jgi:hypothetical protein
MARLSVVAGIWYGPLLSATGSGMRLNRLSVFSPRKSYALIASIYLMDAN